KVSEISRSDLSPMPIPVGVEQNVDITVPKGRFSSLQRVVEIAPHLQVPMKKGTVVGRLVFLLNGKPLKSVPVVTQTAIEKAGWITQMFHKIRSAL
ncbi:D-alanyl-D-alanine carboxypeptidase, partial [Acidithiobacillus ferrooxidans]|nr:D-alanyl-D-alanine carboxypeptidase [Acidithiobacillus ferrooxidans]